MDMAMIMKVLGGLGTAIIAASVYLQVTKNDKIKAFADKYLFWMQPLAELLALCKGADGKWSLPFTMPAKPSDPPAPPPAAK